jgi:hypothetical protein
MLAVSDKKAARILTIFDPIYQEILTTPRTARRLPTHATTARFDAQATRLTRTSVPF